MNQRDEWELIGEVLARTGKLDLALTRIRPLVPRQRRASLCDVLALFDRCFVEWGAPLRTDDFTPRNRAALVMKPWRNLDEIRTAAARFVAIARTPGWDRMRWRARAVALGLPRSTAHEWFALLELTDPLLRQAPGERPQARSAEPSRSDSAERCEPPTVTLDSGSPLAEGTADERQPEVSSEDTTKQR